MLSIGFHENSLNERGTTVALYDYAYYTKYLYGYRPIIFYKKEASNNNKEVIEKFEKEFMCCAYVNFDEVEEKILKENIKYLYTICSGQIGTCNLSKHCKNLVHAVFFVQPHGDKYATISKYLSNIQKRHKNVPYVPHMINLPKEITTNMRSELNIPANAVVLGRYGGFEQFNITYVHEAIKRALDINDALYFLFANTPIFYKHDRIIYFDKIIDLNEKVRFINSCDAMIHARSDGETFGLSIGEFSIKNKPVITCISATFNAHIDILGNKGIYYKDFESCLYIFKNIQSIIKINDDWNAFNDYLPEKVMEKFMEVFDIKNDVPIMKTPPIETNILNNRCYVPTIEDTTGETMENNVLNDDGFYVPNVNTIEKKNLETILYNSNKRILFTQYYTHFVKENCEIYIKLLKPHNYIVDFNNDLTQEIIDSYDILICGSFIQHFPMAKLIISNIKKTVFNMTEPIEFFYKMSVSVYMHNDLPLSIGCVKEDSTNIKFPLYFEYDMGINPFTIKETINCIQSMTDQEILYKQFCCLINRHDYGNTRVPMHNLMSIIGDIACPGKLLNNFPNNEFEKIGRVNFQSRFLFSICPENFIVNFDGYVTEKLFMAIYCGCIPIYYGKMDSIDFKIFNKDRILFFNPQDMNSMKAVASKVLDLIKNNDQLLAFYRQSPFCDSAIETYNAMMENANRRLNDFIHGKPTYKNSTLDKYKTL